MSANTLTDNPNRPADHPPPENGRPQSLGEFRVRMSFNPSGDRTVNSIKGKVAYLIDFIEELKSTHGDPRAGSEAQTLLETAAMFAVKMVTTPPGPAPAPQPDHLPPGAQGGVGGGR